MTAADLYPIETIVTSTIEPEDVVEKGFDELLEASGRNMKILVRVS